MNTKSLRSTLLAAAVLASGTGLAIPAAHAGPGLEYWRPHGKTVSKPAVAPEHGMKRTCTDARVEIVAETRPSWHNGRGPLTTTEVGEKLLCTACDIPMIAMKPSGHNGRGAMAPAETKGRHDCVKNGCATAGAASKSAP
jgi:hypothetical protein